jgi:predicted nucleic acid-binding protein
MVTFDTTFLTLMFVQQASHPVPDAADRVNELLLDLSGAGTQVLIPTPSLSEILVRTGEATEKILSILNQTTRFVIAPFDEKAALELAAMTEAAIKRGDKRDGSKESWAKVKFDRQIVAISKIDQVSVIYSDDHHIESIGAREGMRVVKVADLRRRPSQEDFNLAPPPRG